MGGFEVHDFRGHEGGKYTVSTRLSVSVVVCLVSLEDSSSSLPSSQAKVPLSLHW